MSLFLTEFEAVSDLNKVKKEGDKKSDKTPDVMRATKSKTSKKPRYKANILQAGLNVFIHKMHLLFKIYETGGGKNRRRTDRAVHRPHIFGLRATRRYGARGVLYTPLTPAVVAVKISISYNSTTRNEEL